ncbi:MAG TPA: ABC transporter substrate-binding protein [Gaiellaceae bacterium]|nr:ABC transporter substrate-binding protein [Gaiellaceae bacterium]
MSITRRALVAALVGLAALVAVAASFAQDDDGDKVVLTVGIPEDYDTLNPLVGVEVPDFDVWNLQYATLTDKAAADFATIPGLAESWKASNGGRTYTYTLREGLEWSDGTPLTAEDVVFNVDRGRKEQWLNHYSTVQNLRARAIDDRTVEITSSVPDPKLPTMDVYIVPKHIWSKYDAKAITKFNGVTPVGSGPFTLGEVKRGQFWTMKANPRYWGWKGEDPPIDEVVFRSFNNPDAMVAALKQGEIDAAHDVPASSFEDLETTPGIVALQGQQGGFDELAINGGAGLKKPHPALLDPKVRLAIAHAIDKKTLVDRVLVGLGTVATTVSPSADPEWVPEVPQSALVPFDLAQAKSILEQAGYRDTNGDGVREMPGGGQPLSLKYMVRTESETDGPVSEFVSGWLKEIGIKTTLVPVNESKLTEVIGKGDYDLFTWGWTPYVDPDPMLSYFQCSQIASDPDDPTNYWNDANWCDRTYDRLYKQQNVELDKDARVGLVHRMLRRMYDAHVYDVLWYQGDLQAYRTDRFQGWLRQPAEIGPVIFTNSSPTYANLTPVASTVDGGGGGISTGAIVGIVAAAVAAVGLVAWLLTRRRTADERE